MRTSIICLISRSTDYARYFYECLRRYTPELGVDADFLFVANDATGEVQRFLRARGYPHIIADNDHFTDAELAAKGFAFPEYISRVYQGVNKGMLHASGDEIVLMNSDNFVSPGWLQNLRKRLDKSRVVSPTLVQPHAAFPNPINQSLSLVKDCGLGLTTFREDDFVKWAETIKRDSWSVGNPFMPVLLYKWQAELVGLYPTGNLAGKDFSEIRHTGDTFFFLKLALAGIQHITVGDSIVYHLQEGEKYGK